MDTRAHPLIVAFSIRLPKDLAELLRRLAYERRVTKQSLIIDAIRKTYGEQES